VIAIGGGDLKLGVTMKKLKIIQCRDHLMWYSRKVGQLVPYLGEDVDFKGPIYWSREDAGYKNMVFQCDAEIVEVDVNN
jgi:hypothetical protein